MNELDSELVRGSLMALGYTFTGNPRNADVILYNTCSVREQAENKVWSRVGLMGLRKKEGAAFILGVIGCMAEREGSDMMRRFPQIDLMCGPGELDKLPMLIDNAIKTDEKRFQEPFSAANGDAVEVSQKRFLEPFLGRVALQGNNSRRSTTLTAANDNLEMLDLSRAFDPDASSAGGAGRSAYVRITRGCNKFCTYCVVPYTRGAEIHRPPDSIVEECKKLADHGVIEITLLGQTVNHYIYTHGAAVGAGGIELPQIGPAFKNGSAKAATAPIANGKPRHSHGAALRHTTTFADLLRRIHDEVPAIKRLRFVTSFPRDFGDDILQVMADSPRICKYLHVPAQSGSNRILKLMNRGYTVEEYLEFIARARAMVPEVCIAGDFIVGFPTETDDDFAATMELLRRARYKNSFIFKYSPRPGTVAIDRFEDDVPNEVKRRRNNQLLDLQNQISAEVHAEFVGQTVDVFVERVNERVGAARPTAMGNGGVELRWEKRGQRSEVRGQRSEQQNGPLAESTIEISERRFAEGNSKALQLCGRTGGDLIAVFEPPGAWGAGAAEGMVGQIVPVRVTGSGPLILLGTPA